MLWDGGREGHPCPRMTRHSVQVEESARRRESRSRGSEMAPALDPTPASLGLDFTGRSLASGSRMPRSHGSSLPSPFRSPDSAGSSAGSSAGHAYFRFQASSQWLSSSSIPMNIHTPWQKCGSCIFRPRTMRLGKEFDRLVLDNSTAALLICERPGPTAPRKNREAEALNRSPNKVRLCR
jgi:hypothetical protein